MRWQQQRVRDGQLNVLQDKSSSLQSGTESWNRQAQRLRWEMRWQQQRVVVMVSVVILWLILCVAFREHILTFLPVSLSVLIVAMLLYRCVVRRRCAEYEEADDTERLLTE